MNKLRVLACLAIATTIGTLSLLILRADDQPAVISKAPVSAEAPAASVDSARAKSKIPDVSGIWLYNGEKLVAQFRPAEPAEAFDYRLVIDGQKSPYQLKWSAERKQFEAAFEADRGPGKLLLKPTCDGHAFRGLILVNGEPTHQELVRGVMDGQTVRRADKPAAAEQSDDVLVLETSVGLAAYNEKTGRWHQQTVGLPKDGSSRISHAINGRHFVSVHFDDQLFVFSSPADRWARKTISEKDMENVSIFHGGDEFSVQVGFTKYELTAAGDFVGAEALVPPTVAETDDAKTDPAMPDISGVWMFFQGSEPEQKVKITPGEKGGSANFLTTFQNGTHWEIQWLPDPQVFKATTVKQGDEAQHSYLLRPPSDGSTMFVFKVEDEARQKTLLETGQIGDPRRDVKILEQFATSKLITYKNHTRIAGGDLIIVETKDSLDGYSELTGTWDRAVVPPTNDGFPRLMRATVGQGVAVVALDDRVLFFGRHTGKWTQQQVPPELSQKVIPTVGADFAYAKAGTHLYGYNAHVDHVGELNLPPEDAQKVKPELGLKSLTVIVGDKTYALSPKTGKWTSAEDIAEAATNETAEAKADPAMPDIVGVWMFFQGSEPEQKVKITPGEKGGSDNFLMTFQNGTHWEIQWLPDPQVFKATTVKQGDEAEQTYLLRPPSDGKAMFVFKVEDDAKLTNLLDKEKIGDPKRDSIALNQLATGLLRTYKNQTRFTGNDYFIVETPEGLDGYSGSLGIWDRIQVPPRKDEFPRLLSFTGGQHVAMVVVDDLLLAYSSRTGKWSRHLIDPEQDETAKPFVGQDLAMVQIGNQIYGFSSSVDSIDALTIPPEYQGKAIAIHGFNSLTIQIGDKTYALSPKTGKWTSAEDITEAATNEKAEVKTKPGMPNIAGLWNRSTQVDGDGFPKISRAKVTDSCDFILRWTAESQGEQLTWKEDDQIFEITWEPGKSQASDLIHVSTDGKTLYVFGQIANGERKGLLDRIHHPDISSEKLKAETPNVFDFQDRLVSEEFIIFETDEGLNAFSRITGTWDQMPISLPKDRSPRLTEALGSAHFATTVIDDQLLGYSSQAGKWGRVTIPPESVGKVVPTHSLNIVTAKIGNKTFALSPKTGQWLSPDGKPVSGNDTVTASDQPSEVLVFLAKWSGPCQQIRPMLDSLINEGNPIRLIDVDTNKELTGQYQIKSIPAMVLIRHGRELRRVAGVVTKAQLRQYIDEVRGPDIAAPPTSFSEITPPKSSAKPASPDAKRLAAELWKREAQASAMASEIRELIQKLGPEHREVTESRQQLGETLAAALDLKFQLEQLQISDLQARLSQLEQQIGQRKAQRDKIVQRRAQELIDGEATKWNNGDEPTISTGSGDPRRAENPDRQPTGAATSPPSTSVHFQGPSSLSVFIPHRSAMLGEGHGCEFPQGSGEFLSYALSLNSQEWKSRISANLDIYSTKDSVRKFVDKHHVWFRITDEDLDQIASGNSVTKVAYLPQAKLQMLPDAAIETLVSTRLNPQVDPIEEAKRQGEILAVLRFNLPPPDKETPGKAATDPNKLSRVPSAEVSLEDYASAEDRCWNELGLKFGEKETVFLGPNDGRYGVEVKEVNDNGPAAAAGIRQGYILLGLGPWETRSVKDILWILNHRSPEPTLKAYVYQGVEILTAILNVSPKVPPTRPAPVATETVIDTEEGQISNSPIPPNVTRIHLSIDKKLTGFSKLICNNQLYTFPATIDLPRDDKPVRYPLFLTSEWPVEFERQLGAIEILPATKTTEPYLTQLPVALKIVPEDVHQLAGGNRVTKIVYGRNSQPGSIPAPTDLETLVPTQLNPLTEQLEAANQHGTVVATLLLEPDPVRASKDVPDDTKRKYKAETSPPVAELNAEKEADLDLPARLAKAEGEFKQSILEFQNTERLVQQKVVSSQELELRRAKRDSAAKQYQVLQQEYAAIWRDLELQIEAAELDMAATEKLWNLAKSAHEQARGNLSEVKSAERRLNQAKSTLQRLQNRLTYFKAAGEGLAYGPHAKKNPPNWDGKSSLQAPPETEMTAEVLAAKATACWDQLGLKFEPVAAESLGDFSKQFRGGLRVTEIRPESPAAKADIVVGDIWVGLGRWQTTSFKELAWINDQPKEIQGKTLTVHRLRDGKLWDADYNLSFGNDKR